MIDQPNSILFVCSLNSLRSPMAEGLVKSRFKKSVYVDSVGAEKGLLDQMAVEVMAEINVDISKHRPKSLSGLLDTSFDIIVVLSEGAQGLVCERMKLESAEILNWSIGDPSNIEGNREQRLNAYREVRDCLGNKIEDLLS